MSGQGKHGAGRFDLELFRRWLDIGAEGSLANPDAYSTCVAFEAMCEASGSGRLLTHKIMSAVYRQMVKDHEVASDLLDALEGLTPILEAAESNASGNPELPWVSKRINAARAAIAKARGAA